MVKEAFCTFGAFLFAALSFFSGADRLALSSPSLASFIPKFLEYRAPRGLALQAVAREEPERALRFARLAVHSDPLQSQTTALLGVSYGLLEDFERADDAFRVAALFGWREPATQLYWYQQSLAIGEWELAATRVNAILSVRPGFEFFDELVAPLQSNESGQDQLANMLADEPPWFANFARITPGITNESASERSQVLAMVGTEHRALGCVQVEPHVRALMRRNLRDAALRVWNSNCSEAQEPGNTLSDPDFEVSDLVSYTPFGWNAQRDGQLEVSIVAEGENNQLLRLKNLSNSPRLALTQNIELDAGSYILEGTITGATGTVVGAVGCDGRISQRRAYADPGEGLRQVLTIEDCPGKIFGLFVTPTSEDVYVDGISLTPAQ